MDNPKKSAAYWASEFQKRNSAAFAHVFELHYRPLCYYARTMLANQAEAEDAVSEVLVRLWEKATHFDNLNSIKGFLYISTKNLCLDRLKQQKRQQASLDNYLYAVDTGEGIEDFGMLESEVLAQVYEEIERLPAKAREIFKLIFFHGSKTDEVAIQLGISVKTVRNQKSRAIQLLQTALLRKGLPAFSWLCCLLIER
ncbi:RNA polymerase sigma factor [Parapedobacter indicus]|uniref:RNA polymerase sigma-70 factor, ECF subfamily n=1 Tax=Parapedobacter indicus TaxID=1477437 RepID=A0A1I3PSG5_9SPHI|nr:RNA polymerase sigma-70 factor [Parapedobacter indicus]PPL00552.1 RNA polymerase sigma-70 factor (ECF subfamily) [Parapedobacter indicus]SFJ24320.1 RNA polymerase sigma-70 factor, ECF subfamily [Parapedobacter indicus]